MGKTLVRLATLCLAVVMAVSMVCGNVLAKTGENSHWGVKVKGFSTLIVGTGNTGGGSTYNNTSNANNADAIRGVTYTEKSSSGKFGNAASSTDPIVSFSMPKVFANGAAANSDGEYIYDFCIRQPGYGSPLTVAAGETKYVYYKFILAFDEGGLPGNNGVFFGLSTNTDKTNFAISQLIPPGNYFPQAGRWYDVEVVVTVTPESYTGTLYVDGVQQGTPTETTGVTVSAVNQLSLSFVNEDAADTGSYKFYMDNFYVEWGAENPALIHNDTVLPTSDTDFDFTGGQVVAHSKDATVADFKAKVSNSANYSVVDGNGAAVEDTASIIGNYIVMTSTDAVTYGKDSSINLKTFTGAVTCDDPTYEPPEPEEPGDPTIILPRITFDNDNSLGVQNSSTLPTSATLYHNGKTGVSNSTQGGVNGKASDDNAMFIGKSTASGSDGDFATGIVYRQDNAFITFANSHAIWEYSLCATGDVDRVGINIGTSSGTLLANLQVVPDGAGNDARGYIEKDEWNKITLVMEKGTANYQLYVNGTQVTGVEEFTVDGGLTEGYLSRIHMRVTWDKSSKTAAECAGGIYVDDITLYDKNIADYDVAAANAAPTPLTAGAATTTISAATNCIYADSLANLSITGTYRVAGGGQLADGAVLAVENATSKVYDYYTVAIGNGMVLYPTADGVKAETYTAAGGTRFIAVYDAEGVLVSVTPVTVAAGVVTSEAISTTDVGSLRGYLWSPLSIAPLTDSAALTKF